MFNSKEALRDLINRQLGLDRNPRRERRLAEALLARRCRNIFFGAMAPVVYGAQVADIIIEAQTQPFADPIIVTDILNYNEPYPNLGFLSHELIFQLLLRVFVTGVGSPEDFFATGNFTNSVFSLGHEITVPPAFATPWDAPSTKMHFAPYLLKPGAIFKASWELLDYDPATIGQYHGELHCRGVRVLRSDDPYGQLCGKLKDQVTSYIEAYDPETAIVDLRIPEADFPAAGQSRKYFTSLQDRPLLILGMASNINGAQIQMRDDSTQTNFVASLKVPQDAVNGGAPVAGVYPGNINGLAMYLVAANCDLTLHEAYNIFPVPHLLAPNTPLTFTLTNGLRPRGDAAAFEQSMATTNAQAQSTGDGHIALLCRTV